MSDPIQVTINGDKATMSREDFERLIAIPTRDEFAKAAVSGLATMQSWHPTDIALRAWAIADAMMRHRG